MNNPIINPVLFYLADTAGGLKFLFIIISILLLFISFIFFMEKGLCKKYCIGSAILLIILGILIPSKETCYKMAIAKYVTPHNIEIVSEYVNDVASSVGDATTDTIKELMDYTIDFVYDIRNNNESGD